MRVSILAFASAVLAASAFGQGVYPPAASAPAGGVQASSATPISGAVTGTLGNTAIPQIVGFGAADASGNPQLLPANRFNFQMGSNGTSGTLNQIFADFNDLNFQTNGQGGVNILGADSSPHAFKLQEAGAPFNNARFWYDGAAGTSTGLNIGFGSGLSSALKLDINGNLNVPYFAGVHASWYATPSAWATCAKVAWPQTGCTDATAGLTAARVAAAKNHSHVVLDAPTLPGYAYFVSQLVVNTGEGGWVGTGRQHNNDGGSSIQQIPGQNLDLVVTNPSASGSAYMDYFDWTGINLYGDQSYTSTKGSCFVANSRIGERFNISHSTFNICPENGLVLNHGGDPITWYDVEASANGYGCAANGTAPGLSTSTCGFGIKFNKGGSDPYNVTSVDGISTDNDATAGIGVLNPSGQSTADTFHFSNWKSETRNDGIHDPTGQPFLLIDSGGGPTPIFLDAVNAVVVNSASPIASIARTACSGTSCTVTATLTKGTDTLVYPAVGDNFQISGVPNATDLNQICAVTATTSNTITCTQTTTGANETDAGGNLAWNRKATTAFAFPGTTPANPFFTAINVQGGSNAIGPFGYQNFIQDGASGYNFPLTSLPSTSSQVGSELNSAQYVTKDHRLVVDGQTLVGDLGQAALRISVAGEANPRLAANGNATFFMGTGGSAGPDTLFGRGPNAGSVSVRTNTGVLSGFLTGTVGAHGSGDFFARNIGSTAFPAGTSFFQGNTSTGNYTFSAAQVLHGAGTAAAPSIGFSGDLTSGLYLGSGFLGLAQGGVLAGAVSSTGVTSLGYGVIGSTAPIAGSVNLRQGTGAVRFSSASDTVSTAVQVTSPTGTNSLSFDTTTQGNAAATILAAGATLGGNQVKSAAFQLSTAFDAAGAAATAQTNATAAFTGDVTKAAGSFGTTVTAINGTNLAGLGAGVLKQSAAGIPSIAVNGTDYIAAANPIFTGVLKAPNGTAAAPTFSFANDATSGFFLNAPADFIVDLGGVGAARFIANAGGNAFEALAPTYGLGWGSTTSNGLPSSVDTALWRIGPQAISFGSNTTGTSTGSAYLQGIRSNTASNTDLTGELALSAATTATYTFAKTYTSHPEILLQCQFNCNGNVPWVTYTGATSFTINFATAVTGSVSYGVLGRN